MVNQRRKVKQKQRAAVKSTCVKTGGSDDVSFCKHYMFPTTLLILF